MATFNAATDPWIPVVTVSGERRTVSTSESLRDADRIAGLDLRDPAEHVAVLGHLVGLVYETIGAPTDLETRPDLRHSSSWVRDNVDRFNLFDDARPLGQNPVLAAIADEPGVTLPLHAMAWDAARFRPPLKQALPSWEPLAVTPEWALRMVLARNLVAAGSRIPSASRTKAWGKAVYSWKPTHLWNVIAAHPVGRSLAETLWLNWIPGPAGQVNLSWPDNHPSGGCPWPGGETQERTSSGLADTATFTGRATLLTPPGEDGLIRSAVYTPGDALVEAGTSVWPWVLPGDRGPAKVRVVTGGTWQPWRPWRAVADALGWAAEHPRDGGVLAAAAARDVTCRLMLAAVTPAAPAFPNPDSALLWSTRLPNRQRWSEIAQTVGEQMQRADKVTRRVAKASLAQHPMVRAQESSLLLTPLRRMWADLDDPAGRFVAGESTPDEFTDEATKVVGEAGDRVVSLALGRSIAAAQSAASRAEST